MMTEDDLWAIAERANAAAPGPWEARTFGPCNCGQCPARVNLFLGDGSGWTITQLPNVPPADAAFIAAARTDVPKLIAEVRRLQAIRGVTIELRGFGAIDGSYGPRNTTE